MTIYLDLDGVLADFNGTTDFILKGMGCETGWKEEVEKPMWGIVGSHIKEIYSLLNVLPDAHELVDYAFDYSMGNVEILTAIPRRGHFPDAVDHKRAWVAKHFPKITKVNFGPYAKDKQYHYKLGDILIDDSEQNIIQWKSRGGFAVLHTSTKNTIEHMESQRILGLRNWINTF